MSLSVFIAAGMSVSFFILPCRKFSLNVPCEFSKRPMSAVANYPFHTPTCGEYETEALVNGQTGFLWAPKNL